MAAVCKECEECWNYYVSEIGCFGSSVPCSHYISDAEPEDLEELEDDLCDRGLSW